MKKNFKFIVAAIAAVAMVGCAKDGGEKIDAPKNGTETIASFRISFPKGGTRAVDDVAKPTETTIGNAKVFLFNASQNLESITPMDIEGTKASASNVKTFTGLHYVYVAANIPASLDAAIAALKVADPAAVPTPEAGTLMAEFLKIVINAQASLPTTADQFFMTAYVATSFVAPTIDEPNPIENKVEMGLGRAVAKVNMEDGHGDNADVNPENALVKDLAFKVMNNPIRMRAFQQYSMSLVSTAIVNSGTIVNDVTGDGTTRANYYRIPATYVPNSGTPKDGVYVPENWNATPTTHNATSLLIQGQVKLNDGVAIRKADGTATTVGNADGVYVSGDTFWRVWDKTAEAWLPFYFCASPTLATIKGAAGLTADANAATSNDKFTQNDPGKREFFIAEYTNAIAYWRLPLNNEELEKSVVARNDYFWVTIKSIAEIGASTDSDDPDKDGVIPGKPGEDPKPIDKSEVKIEAEVKVLKWNGIEQNGHI